MFDVYGWITIFWVFIGVLTAYIIYLCEDIPNLPQYKVGSDDTAQSTHEWYHYDD